MGAARESKQERDIPIPPHSTTWAGDSVSGSPLRDPGRESELTDPIRSYPTEMEIKNEEADLTYRKRDFEI